MRTRRVLFVLFAAISGVLAAAPASAQAGSTDTWPQFQGGAARAGDASASPAAPYKTSWQAAAGIGDPSHLAGFPTPVLTGSLAIVVGPQEVDAVNIGDGSAAWSVARALGPSAPPAVTGTTLLFVEGGGDESASASGSPTAAPTSASAPSSVPPSPPDGAPSASVSPTSASVSTLVAVDLSDRKRLWTATLSDVSHTGVLVAGQAAVVGTDDGQISAFSVADGGQLWSVDAGDHVLAPMAASTDLVVSSVRPESSGRPSLLATKVSDGSEAWRFTPPASALDLGGPSVVGDSVYVVASDASVRAVSLADGTQRWATALYTPTLGSPPVVTDSGAFVTDQSGTIYALDPATGVERWRYATNLSVIGAPIATSTSVLQPTNDGSIVAVDVKTGHQIWHASIADNVVLGLAGSSNLIVASHTGTAPGLVALANDPAGTSEDLVSPTTPNPPRLLLYWLLAALPLAAGLIVLGRWLDRRMGQPDLGVPEDLVDPWEADLEGGS